MFSLIHVYIPVTAGQPSIFAAEVHGPGRRVRVHARGERFVQLDRLDARDRRLLELELPRGSGERGGRGARHAPQGPPGLTARGRELPGDGPPFGAS